MMQDDMLSRSFEFSGSDSSQFDVALALVSSSGVFADDVAVGPALAGGLIEFSAQFHSAVPVDFLAFLEQTLVFEYLFIRKAAFVLFDLEEGRLAVFIALLLALLLLLLLQLLLTGLRLFVKFEPCL